jgi:HAE1 family hydrophobic/amphiphilic exporter-1
LVWLADRYAVVLRWTLSHRTDSAMILLAMALLTWGVAVPGVRCTGEPEENLNDFTIRLEVPPQMGSGDRDGALVSIESAVEDHIEAWGVKVYRSQLEGDSNYGRVVVYLESDGPMMRDAVMDAAREVMPKDQPGVKITVGWEGGEDGEAAAQQIRLQISGEDLDTLSELSNEVARRLETVPGVMEVQPDVLDDGSDEVRLRIDRDAVARQGLSAQQVGGTVAWAMRQNRMNPMRQGDYEIPVVSSFMLEDRDHLDTLLDFEVFSMANMTLVPLRSLTSTEMGKGPSQIRRQDRRTGMGVTADLEEGASFIEVYKAVDAALADMVFPRGYEWSKGQRWDNQMDDDAAMKFALFLSVAFVFLLMGVLFESFVLPLAIVTTIPMAMMGAVWGLYLSGTGMDTMAGVGLVILVGVVVNNGIVLIDLVEQLRAGGVRRNAALMDAGRRRLRPILMTALTTVCGLMPMAIGTSAIAGVPYAPLGRTVIGGLLAGTLLTLLFVPYLYTLLDDLRTASKSWFGFVWSATK